MDGAAVVHYLLPDKGKTFADYVRDTFFPHICRALDHHQRVDIIFDNYKNDSLKEGTRKAHGKGVRLKVFLNRAYSVAKKTGRIFLNDADNKSELFCLLDEDTKSLIVPANKQLILTLGDDVVCVPEREVTRCLRLPVQPRRSRFEVNGAPFRCGI